MLTINFENIPKQHEEQVTNYINQAKGLIPTWCQYLTVNYNLQPTTGSTNNILGESWINHPYRTAGITLLPLFFESSKEEQWDTIIHEVLHISVNVIHEAALTIINNYLEGKSANYAKDNIEDALEMVVCDLTASIIEGLRD